DDAHDARWAGDAVEDAGHDIANDVEQEKPPVGRPRRAAGGGERVLVRFRDRLPESDRASLQVALLLARLAWAVRRSGCLRIWRIWGPHVVLRISPESGSAERD